MRALFLGFGNVGRRVAEILADRGPYPGLAGLDVAVVGIVTGAHGGLANPRGIDLAGALAHRAAKGGFAGHPDASTLGPVEAARTLDYDVLVEMTPLSVEGRGEPAITHVREALDRGRHVVSANKGPLAWAYRELAARARAAGASFLHEATVMDGVPVFNLARHGLRGATIRRIEGILNSTTNVVMGVLEGGGTVEEAVARAQAGGYAEADPAHDLDGWDAAVKIAALANVLMDAGLRPEDVPRASVRGLTALRARDALGRGARLKVVAEAVRGEGGVRAQVALREVPREDPFALVSGTSSILRLETDLAGRLVVTEEGPDLTTTAYGVLSDLLALAALRPR